MTEKQSNESKKKVPININWKLLIVGFLVLNLGSLLLVVLYALITGARELDDNMFAAITGAQMVALYLTGMLLGYWSGEWPKWEMLLIFVTSVQTAMRQFTKESFDLTNLLMTGCYLALYGVVFWGGALTGQRFKQHKLKKQQSRTSKSKQHTKRG